MASDALTVAEVIVVSSAAGGAGAIEAADLVDGGMARRVAVFQDPPSGEDFEFIRRGLAYEDLAARQSRQLASLGVTDVLRIPRREAGTGTEGPALAAWCAAQGYRSVIFVAARDHSRRTRRVLRRAMSGHHTSIAVRPARHSSFDPDRWWQSREGVRTEIVELQKLVLDVLLHPWPF